MNDREFIEKLKKSIPTKHNDSPSADYVYKDLHWMIDNHLKEPSVRDYK